MQSEVSVGEGPQLVGGMFGGGNESTEYTGEYFGGGVGGGLLPATVTLMITNSESKKSEIQPIVDAFKQVGKDVSDTYNDAIDYVSDLF